MSDNRPQDGNENEEQQNEGGNRKGGKVLLDYSLTPFKDAAVFVIHQQSELLTNFLKKVGRFEAPNGVRISLGHLFPEWQESSNTILLDGTNGREYGRPDTTRFPSGEMYYRNGRNRIRDNKMALFNDAIRDLVDTVKSSSGLQEEETLKPRAERIVLS